MQRDIDQINVIPLVDVMLVLWSSADHRHLISSGQIPVNWQSKEAGDRKEAPS